MRHKHRNKTSKLLSFIFLVPALVLAQLPIDSLSHPHRHAIIQTLGQDMSIWAFNSYVMNQPWAKISLNTLETNISNGWVWDEDEFNVNQIGHPSQGALVYLGARAHGLSLWQSMPYPFLGSLIWELGMETESPSINDMITTPLSGIAFGEMIHRLSILTLGPNPNASLTRQIAAGIMNPTGYGINRLLFGKVIHKNFAYKSLPLLGDIAFGGGPRFIKTNEESLFPRRFIKFNLAHGNPFDIDKEYAPFDFFTFTSVLNMSRTEYVGEIYSSGMLKKMYQKNKRNYKTVLGLFQNYDFMNHDDYKVSSASIGLNYLQFYRISPQLNLRSQIASSFIILGSAGDTSDETTGRDYHFGPGASGKIMIKFTWMQHLGMYFQLKRYFIYAVDESKVTHYENINLLNSGFQIHLYKGLSLGGEYDVAGRKITTEEHDLEFLQSGNIYRLYFVYQFVNTLLTKNM
jgi:hypothetical protein